MNAPSSASPSARYPMLLLAVSFAGGIAFADFAELSIAVSSATGAAAMLLAAVIAKSRIAVVVVFAAFAMLGAAGLQLHKSPVADHRIKRILDENRIVSGEPLEVEGVLTFGPELAHDGAFLLLQVERISHRGVDLAASGDVRLFALTRTDESREDFARLGLRYGSRVCIASSINREERFLNPGVISRKALLDRQGIDASGTVKSPLLIEKLSEGDVFTPLRWVFELRAQLIEGFRDKLSGPAAGIMIASLLGDKHFLDRQTAEVFREGGTFHILVISGLHITFIGGILLWLVRRVTRRRALHFIVPVIFLWAYTLAVGAEVPVVRASLMFTILLFSHVIYRQASLINSLGFCTLLLLVWNPEDMFDPSFQLTFVSVSAIVAFAFPLIEKLRSIGNWTPDAAEPFPPHVSMRIKRFCEMLYWREEAWEIESGRQVWSMRIFKSPYLKWLEAKDLQGIAAYLFEGILVSLIVQICLLPLLIYYFHRVSPASVLLNLWVGVVIALESFAAIIGVLIAGFSDLIAAPFLQITEFLNLLLLRVPGLLVDVSTTSIRVPVYSEWMKAIYLAYLLPIVLLAIILGRWDPFALKRSPRDFRISLATGTASAALALLIVFHPFSSPAPKGRLTVEFLDVGQGDAAFITFPNGETMLVDGGGRVSYTDPDEEAPFEPDVPRIGEAVVSEFLWERGYSSVDYIVATHADADHIQGLSDVVKNFSVGKALLGHMPAEDPELNELLEVLKLRSIEPEGLASGDRIEIGGVQLDILHPGPAGMGAVSDNNSSIVLRLAYGSRSILLTGDVEVDGEGALLRSPELLRSDVVKVPHHGSKTSSTPAFVEAVRPEYAIISVGRDSIFGHPHREVVDRWRNAGSQLLITGHEGMITVSTDGQELIVNQMFRE